jgi:hypothetical protein
MTTVQADFVYVGSPQLFPGWSEIFAGVWQAPDVGVVDFGTSVCDGHAPADGEFFLAYNGNVGAPDQVKQQVFQVVDCGYHVVLGLPVFTQPKVKRAAGYEGGAAYVADLRVYVKNGTVYGGQWLSLLTVPPVLLDQDTVTWLVDNIYPPTMNNAWTGRGIGNDTYAVQKTAAADFLALYPDFPTLDQATQDAIIADLNRLMAQVMGNAVITHAPGYGGTVTTAPNTGAGFDLPIPSFVVMVDGAGAFSSLWWKSGIPPTAWVQVAGSGGGGVTLSSDIPLPDGIGNAGDLASGQATAKGHVHPANPAPPPPATATGTLYTAKVGASLDMGSVYCAFLGPHTPHSNTPMFEVDFAEISPGVMQRDVTGPIPDSWFDGVIVTPPRGETSPLVGKRVIAYYQGDTSVTGFEEPYQLVWIIDDVGFHWEPYLDAYIGVSTYARMHLDPAMSYSAAWGTGMKFSVENGTLFGGGYFTFLNTPPFVLRTTFVSWSWTAGAIPASDEKWELLTGPQITSEGALTTTLQQTATGTGLGVGIGFNETEMPLWFDTLLGTPGTDLLAGPYAFDAEDVGASPTADPGALVVLRAKLYDVESSTMILFIDFPLPPGAVGSSPVLAHAVTALASTYTWTPGHHLRLKFALWTDSATPVLLGMTYNSASRGTKLTVPFEMPVTGASDGVHGHLEGRDATDQHPTKAVSPDTKTDVTITAGVMPAVPYGSFANVISASSSFDFIDAAGWPANGVLEVYFGVACAILSDHTATGTNRPIRTYKGTFSSYQVVNVRAGATVMFRFRPDLGSSGMWLLKEMQQG